MDKLSKNHILPPSVQRENDLESIRNILIMYNLENNARFLYLLLEEYSKTDCNNIDLCVKIVQERLNQHEGIIILDDNQI